jgi:hypothetical protein
VVFAVAAQHAIIEEILAVCMASNAISLLIFSSFHWYIGTRDHGQRSTPLQLHWLFFASISKEQERSSTFH